MKCLNKNSVLLIHLRIATFHNTDSNIDTKFKDKFISYCDQHLFMLNTIRNFYFILDFDNVSLQRTAFKPAILVKAMAASTVSFVQVSSKRLCEADAFLSNEAPGDVMGAYLTFLLFNSEVPSVSLFPKMLSIGWIVDGEVV